MGNTLTQPENDDFKTYTREQIMARLGVTADDLKPLYCDGKWEFEFLPEFAHPNAAGDSLRIQDEEKKVYVYQKGALTQDGAPARSRSDYVSDVMKTLGELEALPTGKILLDRIEHAPYPVTIMAGDPHFAAADDTGKQFSGLSMAQAVQYLITLRRADYGEQFNRIGTGGPLTFTRDFSADFIEADGKTRSVKPWVVMAHEMYHAFDSERGLLDRRWVDGDGYEYNELSEYRATFMENTIRAESGLKYRKYYGSYSKKELKDPKIVHGGLLGEDGKPFLMPAPCLSSEK